MTPIPVFPEFKNLELEDRKAIESFTLRFEPYSDLNFTSLWCWDTDNGVALSVLDGNLVVRLPSYGEDGPARYTLLGDSELASAARRILTERTFNGMLNLVPEVVAERLAVDDRFVVVEDQDNADYVVDIAKFLRRAGNSYHEMRRDINQFVRRWAPRIVDLDLRQVASRDFIDEVARQWFANHADGISSTGSDPECEALAIARCVGLGESIRGLGLLIDGDPYSFQLFELVGSHWCIGHFAKTRNPLRGATAFAMDAKLTQCFAAGSRFFNEEQDLGLPGLRTAKLSHRPARFLRKYSVTAADDKS